MRRTPKIAFMTTLGVNVGDEFIREGIFSFFDEIFDNWEPYYVNKHNLKSLFEKTGGEVSYLGDKFLDADIIVQAGTPVYWKLGNSTSYNVDWADELWKKRIFHLGPEKPIFNIAAGSCQAYHDFARPFLSDSACIEFAKNAHAACRWTSVRDPLASQILLALRLEHDVLPCAAFHAPRRGHDSNKKGKFVGVNLMPYAGHYKLTDEIDENRWDNLIKGFLPRIRKRHPLLFIAHDEIEQKFIEQYRSMDEVIFLSNRWEDYLKVYQECKVVIANRVHGAVCAAGFGCPAIIVGNDSRLLIGDLIDIPSLYVNQVDASELEELIEKALYWHDKEKERLLALREETARRYCEAIQEGIENKKKSSCIEGEKIIGIPSISEIVSAPYRSFIRTLNCFSKRWGLRESQEYPEIWVFPWTWFNCLSKMDWNKTSVLIADDVMNPLGWFLSSLGGDITIIGDQISGIYHWGNIRERTRLNVQWEDAQKGSIPFEKDRFDIVLSLSLNNPFWGRRDNFNEMVRVLKPGGMFVTTFLLERNELEKEFSGVEEKLENPSAFNFRGCLIDKDGEPHIPSIRIREKKLRESPLVGCAIIKK